MTILTVSTREMRARLRDILDQVLKGEDVRVVRNGKPVAVLIPAEDYEQIIEELDDLRVARQATAIYEEWKRDPSTGIPYDEVRAELVSEGRLDG